MESQCNYIEISFLKNILIYWTKIISKPRQSLVRRCYDAMKDTKDKKKMKFNWYRDLLSLLEKFGCDSLVENDPGFDEYYTINVVRSSIISKLACVRDNLVQNDIIRMQNSVKMPLYKILRTHCKLDEIMNSNTNWSCLSLLIQIRSNIPRISFKDKNVTFNAMNTYFGNPVRDGNDKCSLCSRDSSETMYHVLFWCPAYDLIRRDILDIGNFPQSSEYALNWVKCLNVNVLRKLGSYFEKVFEIREEWLNEFC
jgi:hypothetical protein